MRQLGASRLGDSRCLIGCFPAVTVHQLLGPGGHHQCRAGAAGVAESHRSAESAQRIPGTVEGVKFVDVIAGGGKQFPRARRNRTFRRIDAIENETVIALEKSGAVEVPQAIGSVMSS